MLNRNLLTKKAILKCQEVDKAEFRDSICSLSISVGQPYHEGDKFLSTLVAINESFKECIILVCSSLYRHTMKPGSNLSTDELHKKANLLGIEWVERNRHAIEQLDIPFKILHWDSWLTHPNYLKAHESVDKLHKTDIGFKEALEDTAWLFLKRQLIKTDNVDIEQEILSSTTDYLKKERAGMLLWAESGYQFELYPNQRNAAMEFVYRHVICKFNPKLVRAISVKFKNLVPMQIPPSSEQLALESHARRSYNATSTLEQVAA